MVNNTLQQATFISPHKYRIRLIQLPALLYNYLYAVISADTAQCDLMYMSTFLRNYNNIY